jgi:predicted nucleic acid-binding protein
MDAAAFEAFRAASSARVYHAVIAAAVPGLPAFVDIALEAGRAAARAVEAAYERSMADGSYRRRG